MHRSLRYFVLLERMFPVIAAIPCMLGVTRNMSFSFLFSLLTNFLSGVSNALKALDLTFCLSFAEFVSLGIATSYGGG